MSTPITFRVYKGDELVQTTVLDQEVIKIGKLLSSHLRIEDGNVSRMHAVIEVMSSDEIFIIDLGSHAGTVVNGRKVVKALLRSGDEIFFGGARVVVEFDTPPADSEDENLPESVEVGKEIVHRLLDHALARLERLEEMSRSETLGGKTWESFAPPPIFTREQRDVLAAFVVESFLSLEAMRVHAEEQGLANPLSVAARHAMVANPEKP